MVDRRETQPTAEGAAEISRADQFSRPADNQPKTADTFGHTDSGTLWDPRAAERYASARHGADGNLLLDPHFLRAIETFAPDKLVADIGCGACPWAIHSVESGAALVLAIDNADGMVEQAERAVVESKLQDKILVSKGDAYSLDWAPGTIQLALSINVGCNLAELKGHINEIAEVLEAGGKAIITAPDNFGVLFTDGTRDLDELKQDTQKRLASLAPDAGLPKFKEQFDNAAEILRATFAKVDGSWALIEDSSLLTPGDVIFRKIPGLIVPNRYHAVDEYVDAIKSQGSLVITENTQAKVPDMKALLQYNGSNEGGTLGVEYLDSNPFAVLLLEKQSD